MIDYHKTASQKSWLPLLPIYTKFYNQTYKRITKAANHSPNYTEGADGQTFDTPLAI